MTRYNNPILKGFYPDPSICRVDEDYYMVTSTFTYFPGVPIFHSTDLVHWKQIGNVLDRATQIPLLNGHHSCGIFAPTLRYNEGTFYMITTNVANGGNFIVTSKDPRGPWSEPFYLNAEGIDPSLYFEEGRCFYCGTKDRREGGKYFGDNEIYIQELDLLTMQLVGDSYAAWHGALRNTSWPEGPHIYKKDDWYYLMISEAGTGHEHAVTIARSKSLTEPFEGYNMNPILTHRHLGRNYPIVNVGHPDIVETQDGQWWMVLLASRPYGGYYRNLGRETFLVPMEWENGWPLINPGIGKVEFAGTAPDLPYCEPILPDECEHFDQGNLPLHFMYSRNPDMRDYSLTERQSHLRMYLSEVGLNEEKNTSFVCRRQQDMTYRASVKLDFSPNEGDFGGVSLFQSNQFYYAFGLAKINDKYCMVLKKCEGGTEEIIASTEVLGEIREWELMVHAHEQALKFSYKAKGEERFKVLAQEVDGRILSTDIAGGFVGTCIGLFGISASNNERNYIEFDWFKLVGLDRSIGGTDI